MTTVSISRQDPAVKNGKGEIRIMRFVLINDPFPN